MRPRCSPGSGPRGSPSCVRTLEPGSGVDPSFEQTSVAPNPTPRGKPRPYRRPCRAIPFRPFPEVPTPMPDRLPYTGNDNADALLAHDPLALLVGFALDQQVTVQK